MNAILFDLDNTLIDRDAAVRAALGVDAGEAVAGSLLQIAVRHGRDPRQLRAAMLDAIEPDVRVIDLLTALRRRARLGLITNGSGRTQRAKLRRAGLAALFDVALISGEQGIAKPDPAVFERALAALGARAADALVVGDDPRCDIGPARQLGIRSFWVSGGRAYPADRPPPDHTGESVLSLHRLVVS